MATQETQLLDDIILKSRRKILTLGATSLAGIALGTAATPTAHAATTYNDNDILNFALNLEYLEASFYYQAAFGTTIDVANAASSNAGAPVITLNQTVGNKGTVTGGSQVPFTSNPTIASYAIETAVEEGKHVKLLQAALGPLAVAIPNINIAGGTSTSAFGALATAAAIPNGSTFSPYTSENNFLVGAYIFEDVGVTAYHGAASLLTSASNLSTAAGILAVEAYHAGLVRTTINYIDPSQTTIGGYTNLISTLRAKLSQAASPATLTANTPASIYDASPDDLGLKTFTTGVALGAGTTVIATRITDADATNVIAFTRNTLQVLNIVTGGGAVTPAAGTAAAVIHSPATGIFFPTGMNGLFQ